MKAFRIQNRNRNYNQNQFWNLQYACFSSILKTYACLICWFFRIWNHPIDFKSDPNSKLCNLIQIRVNHNSVPHASLSKSEFILRPKLWNTASRILDRQELSEVVIHYAIFEVIGYMGRFRNGMVLTPEDPAGSIPNFISLYLGLDW